MASPRLPLEYRICDRPFRQGLNQIANISAHNALEKIKTSTSWRIDRMTGSKCGEQSSRFERGFCRRSGAT